MIERISELPWASFEKQLKQRCYEIKRGLDDIATPDVVPVFNGQSSSSSSASNSPGQYWTINNESTVADIIYCIQHQIIYNISSLLGEDRGSNIPLFSNYKRDEASWYSPDETFFWDDITRYTESDFSTGTIPSWAIDKAKREPFSDSDSGRAELKGSRFFIDSFTDTGISETDDHLSAFPKTHAAQSLLEISEYLGPENPESKHSNYVSRKISLAWVFNVIKAIVDVKTWFRRLFVGKDLVEITCDHPEAENDANAKSSGHGAHKFKRCREPTKFGRVGIYGNAELNGEVTTFHSQARFHYGVRMWDTLHVYGQSHFAKDINGTAMRVRWGDLAEYYLADKIYEPGTLVRFGGSKEVTVADGVANAVVTTKPGLVLNGKDRDMARETCVAIALVGRVPVAVWGGCKKFDLLVSDPDHPGYAKVMKDEGGQPIARALEDSKEDMVMCATNFRL